jgi:hypothetical protein
MHRAVEIALDNLDRLKGTEAERPVVFAVEALMYREDWGEDSANSRDSMLSILKTHLRQSGVLSAAERSELMGS